MARKIPILYQTQFFDIGVDIKTVLYRIKDWKKLNGTKKRTPGHKKSARRETEYQNIIKERGTGRFRGEKLGHIARNCYKNTVYKVNLANEVVDVSEAMKDKVGINGLNTFL